MMGGVDRERGYFVQIINNFHQVGGGLEARDLFVELFSAENIAQLVWELVRRLVQPEKFLLEVGVRDHGQVSSANGDVAGAWSRGEGSLSEKSEGVKGRGSRYSSVLSANMCIMGAYRPLRGYGAQGSHVSIRRGMP